MMNLKKMKLRETVMLIYKALVGHVGAGGEGVHDSASDYSDGFMTSRHVKNLSEAKGQRTWVSKVDVFSLNPGYYEGNQLENTPDTGATYEVDIRLGFNERKQITLIESGSGKMFIRTFHTNGVAGNSPNGWSNVNRELVLWSGNESESGKTLACIQDPRIFRKIRVEIDLNGTGSVSATFDSVQTNKLYNTQGLNVSDGASSNVFFLYKIGLSPISGTANFNLVRNKMIAIRNGVPEIESSGLATVTKIVGIQ